MTVFYSNLQNNVTVTIDRTFSVQGQNNLQCKVAAATSGPVTTTKLSATKYLCSFNVPLEQETTLTLAIGTILVTNTIPIHIVAKTYS